LPNIAKGRPSQWLTVQERLLKMLVVLCRQLCLSPLARTPHKNGRPEAVDQNGHGNGHVSAYELMRLTAILLKNNAIWLKTFSVPRIANRTITGTSHRA